MPVSPLPSPLIADVLVPVAVDTAYSYRVPPATRLAPGDFVIVPLGPRTTLGVVWSLRQGAADNLKPVISRLDWPAMAEPLRQFLDWLAHWTLMPRGMALRMAIRAPDEAGDEPVRLGLIRTGTAPRRLTPARQRVLDALTPGIILPKRSLLDAAACSAGVVEGLIDDGVLAPVPLPADPAPPAPDPGFAAVHFEPDQAEAAGQLAAAVRDQRFGVTLLEGVTGSGKTEVYFEAIAEALALGRQSLILLPEIALTAQFLDRFRARFGVPPAEWHSGVTSRRRARIWSGVATGEIRVVAGARSALFLPFRELGLIVVDEEHEAAYKQDEGASYHARDMAVMRGRFEQASVVLASATPSIESRVNAEAGRYRHLRLAARFGGRSLPDLEVVDLRKDPPPKGSWLAPRLVSAVADHLAAGEQVLLFLNRRGYAPLTVCRSCGHQFQCPNCAAWLVEHRFRGALVCHFCGHVERRPNHCPECGSVGSLVACGPGIERIAEEAERLFPDARRLILSSDHPGGAVGLRHELDLVARGAVDLIIGTQLVAKGHHFPGLTLAAVLDADVGLGHGDPRAAERTFQLLRQVTGRAGRGDRPGRAILQTYNPDQPVIQALLSGDSEQFYATEIAIRRRGGLPPFGRLAAIIVSGPDKTATEAHGRALARAGFALTGSDAMASELGLGGIEIFGPSEAPIAMIRGRHRFRLLVKAPRSADLQDFLRRLLATAPKPRGGLKVAVDIDPQSFF